MSTLTQPQIDAAQEFVRVTIDALKSDRGVHAETAIAGAARLAGTYLLRSFGLPLTGMTPGQMLLSEPANEHGPRLVAVLDGVLTHLGVNIDPARRGGPPGPDNQPQDDLLESQRRLGPGFAAVRARHGLSDSEAAEAGAVAAAILIQQTAPVLDPHVAFGLAVYGFVEGAKTVPDPAAG